MSAATDLGLVVPAAAMALSVVHEETQKIWSDFNEDHSRDITNHLEFRFLPVSAKHT